MNDMTSVIVPKSDQINADDLIAGPMTITIAAIKITPGTEQPVSIGFDGDNGKPYKPCKSMSRVLVALWGPDANAYIGRSLTLYRDPTVKWGGMEVGGIRISHMTNIEKSATLALTATKGSRKPHVVKPLDAPAKAAPAARTPPAAPSFVDKVRTRLAAAQGPDDVAAVANAAAVKNALQEAPEDVRRTLNEAIASAYARVDGTQDDAHSDFAET